MTERRADRVARDTSGLRIGPSALAWDGTTLTIRIDEVTAPIPRRLRGTVRVTPSAVTARAFALDAAGRHHWWPIAPASSVEVALESPALRWSGTGYFDSNWGAAPLERDFVSWNWSRAPLPDGTAILYEALRRDATTQCLALHVDRSGAVNDIAAPSPVALPATRWRVPRATRSEGAAHVVRTLEDTPFYSRSVLETRLGGHAVTAMHESLSLDRFRAPLVQAMLPFRVPRRFRQAPPGA
jgi:carotenoid 1,2-hydratase